VVPDPQLPILSHSKGTLVWGCVASLHTFSELEITDESTAKKLHPGTLIREVNMLGLFWTVHQYDGLLRTLETVRHGRTGLALDQFLSFRDDKTNREQPHAQGRIDV
jgi:hypothetical protein